MLKRILIPRRAQKPVFVVSGLPRSGTSLMMMILNAAGIQNLTDNERRPDDDNPRGYFELERVKKMKDGDLAWMKNARGKSVKVISALLPYLPQEFNYRVFFMLRSLPEILASQRKMLINRGENPEKTSDAEMALSFEQHLNQIKEWLYHQPNFTTLYVDYNQLLKDPKPIIHQVSQFLGGDLDEDKMLNSIDPNLYRQRKTTLL
jgi:LPS sulfotransferase NodH